MTWDKHVVRATMLGAGDYPAVQLELLLRRLECVPGAVEAIAEAIRDMGNFYLQQADAFQADGRRTAAHLIELHQNQADLQK